MPDVGELIQNSLHTTVHSEELYLARAVKYEVVTACIILLHLSTV